MKKRSDSRFTILIATLLILTIIVQFPSIEHAIAEVPAPNSWKGQGAMAHWNITDTAHDNALILMDVVYGQQTSDNKSNMIYIKVEHPQGISEATGYTANITSGPTWSMDHVYINATLTFNWTTGYSAHPVAIEWFASPPSTTNSITWQNGSKGYLPGEWRSGNGTMANATMTIGGSGPHPRNYTSEWAAVGQTTTFPAPTNWTGQGAMAHWDIIDTAHSNVPIVIDLVYGQRTIDGSNSNMLNIKVIHPQGTSEATGYTINMTSTPLWNLDHVFINATLTFNWTNGYSAHPMTIEWYTSPPTTINSITWQNGTKGYLPGEWRSGNGNLANATMKIGGSGPHPSNYTSNWAAVGQTTTFPAPTNWTGQGAMAHWDIIDTAHSNVPITIDAMYGQQSRDGTGNSDLIYIKVIHPQGTSEATGYTANITGTPIWSMNHVFINATLTFNWTNGYSAHPITIEWYTSGPTISNSITWQNGTTTGVPGEWRSGLGNIVNATMTIKGSGPHPGRYVSDWAAVGQTTTFPAPTWTGYGAMAHWDIIDKQHGNAMISMDVFYGQYAGDGKADVVWIKVIHPQGTSEAIGYAANITGGPLYNMDFVSVNTTLVFNWTNGLSNHPITLKWISISPKVSNSITWQNGSVTTVTGDWRVANATMAIAGQGPHPGNYTSNWAVVGTTSPTPAVTPSPTPTVTPTPTSSPRSTPTPTAKPTVTPTPTPSPNPSIMNATKEDGATVELTIKGNITSTQITNITIATNLTEATTTLSFKVTGDSGTIGFSNITIPKNTISVGTEPTIYVDGQPAQDQDFTEDSSNYYVWYTVHFSTHEILVVFTPPVTNISSPIILYALAIAIVLLIAVAAVFVVSKRRKNK